MGCDIHCFAEVKTSRGWQPHDTEVNPDKDDQGQPEYQMVEVFDGRDYRVFSMLADVRSRGDGYIIRQPRGIPLDPSKWYQEKLDDWKVDAHSHSWLTLRELDDFNWTRKDENGDPLYRRAVSLLTETVPILRQAANEAGVSTDNVRIVFFFDN